MTMNSIFRRQNQTKVEGGSGGVHRFADVIIGHGLTRDETHMNANFSLAGARDRDFDAARRFRSRMYQQFGVPEPAGRKTHSGDDRDSNGVLSGILISSPSHHHCGAWKDRPP